MQTRYAAGIVPIRHPRRWRWSTALIYLTLVALGVLFTTPFLWLLSSALKTDAELSAMPTILIPPHPQWLNFKLAVTMVDYLGYARNTLFLSVLNMTLTTVTSALVGFGFARLRGRGKGPLFVVMLSMTMIPGILTLVPTYISITRLHLIYTYWPWVFWGLGSSPILAFLFRQFFSGIPADLEDAAFVDGCSYWRIFWQIFLPLSRPVIVVSCILSFQYTWNDYYTPSIFLNVTNYTLGVSIAEGYTQPVTLISLVNVTAAAACMYAVPIIVLFFFAQRFFVRGIVTTGLKG